MHSKSLSIDLKKKFNIDVITLSPGEIITGLNPNGLINSDVCAKKIFIFKYQFTFWLQWKI